MQVKKAVQFVLSVLIVVSFVAIAALMFAWSIGALDLTSEPEVHAEENTTGVPVVSASVHPSIDGEELEMEIFQKVNQRRMDAEKEPFVHSERVRLIARLHSKDMAERGFFNHTNPDGQGSAERHEEFGGCDITNENIAEWEPAPTNDTNDISKRIVDGWSNSTGHNTTQMSEYYNVAGVGVYVTENRSVYIAMNFCREHPNA